MPIETLEIYQSQRKHIRSGDLIEFSSDNLTGRLIRFFTGQSVNHSALVVRFTEHDLNDHVFLIEAISKGLQINRLSLRLEDYKGEAWWLPLKSELGQSIRDKIVKYGFMQKTTLRKAGYDFVSLFANIFGPVNLDAKRFFCSEFYQACLRHAGLYLTLQKALRPGEFYQLGLHTKRVRIK